MTRLIPTSEEHHARYLLENYFEQNHLEYVIDELITDCPDLVFVSNGERIACEFTQYNQKYPENFPPEPDYLTQSIIRSKNKKVSKYLENGNARFCWLVLHWGLNAHSDEPIDPRLVRMMQNTASIISHNFSKILLLSDKHHTFEIYTSNMNKELWYQTNSTYV